MQHDTDLKVDRLSHFLSSTGSEIHSLTAPDLELLWHNSQTKDGLKSKTYLNETF